MKSTFCQLGLAAGCVLLSFSAHAACGGGGFKEVTSSSQERKVSRESSNSDSRGSKLADLQRDVNKAQAKFDRCQGDCENERRKLEQAKAKLAKKASEL
jgi:molecular chaperone GrpE (heat shock protein)